jgi:TDG/mug DNA glycosylase family protein
VELRDIAVEHLPGLLADAHRGLAVGDRVEVVLRGPRCHDDVLVDLFTGAGFRVESVDPRRGRVDVTATRLRTLPDVVGPDMRLLVCGLNPSLYSADLGVGYARPGNRFWPAALAAGIASVDRDPPHALAHHGTGFSDLVKRASVGAAELTAAEYIEGLARLDRLGALLRPRAIAFCGLTGWRAATGERKAVAGWQARRVGGTPAYVLPNPSGLNARANVRTLAAHLHQAYWDDDPHA